ncbi:MAG: pyridoxamine 5'-phosphate oxidase family protein [Acidobacteriota bacterium]|nr:pyridoxamine 5'-phosphate oxidase family protein [Acidobacteriota bacterium]
MTHSEVVAFIAGHKLGVLGSISPLGTPQSALVGIAVTPELEIIFDTVNTSRKYRNLTTNPAASFVIGWEGEITLQYEGEAREPRGPELGHHKEIYFAAWPECLAHENWPGIAYFVVRPKWIRYSDYNQTPPLIEEFLFC